MDIERIRQLAGVPQTELNVMYRQLNEVVEIPEDVTMEQLIERLDACKRALSIVHRLQDPADKKKWMSATFVNLNKVRGALQRILAKMDATAAGGADAMAVSKVATGQ